ncbi:unnamed protein product [Allacma fusca]|uniref:Uncharacterized protein n=1 Tax=Allacma fusca TaxID=39272 RepID=A0A8J2PN68_9HEXA|nr:unnamed protein product [Allacma fusca]
MIFAPRQEVPEFQSDRHNFPTRYPIPHLRPANMLSMKLAFRILCIVSIVIAVSVILASLAYLIGVHRFFQANAVAGVGIVTSLAQIALAVLLLITSNDLDVPQYLAHTAVEQKTLNMDFKQGQVETLRVPQSVQDTRRRAPLVVINDMDGIYP